MEATVDCLIERYVPELTRWASGRLPGWARHSVDTDDLVLTLLHGRPLVRGAAGSLQHQRDAEHHEREEMTNADHGEPPGRPGVHAALDVVDPEPEAERLR